MILEMIRVGSVVELGCGVGTWLDVFARGGVQDFLGIEGHWVGEDSLVIPPGHFMHHDLRVPLDLGRRFDLAVSLEVAEHLPESAAGTFVRSLTTLAPVVLFSAAVPFQGGRLHVNERWPEYWAGLFRARDYQAADAIRPRIWSDTRVRPWYAQNILLFIDREHLESLDPDGPLPRAVNRTDLGRLSFAHPSLYERNSDPRRWSLRTVLRVLPRLTWRAVLRRFS